MDRTSDKSVAKLDAASELLRQSPLLAAIVDSSEDAIISKDLNGIITSWNPAAVEMFGYTAEEIVGQSVLRLIPKELYSEEAEILRKLRAGARIEHYETVRVRKDGKRIEVSLTISPIKDSTGVVIGGSKIARNISARKRLERSLIQSEKLAATGRIAAKVAHEINNPLESVLNLIFLARESCSPESETYAYLETAEKEIERVAHIARQTLGYYRDTKESAQVSFEELLKNVLSVYQAKFTIANIAVRCQFDTCRTVQASRGEMLQIFSNIIANSIDAMAYGGSLFVQTVEETQAGIEGVRVIIRDQGTGIEPEHLARVFEPFFTTKEQLGTGIGLWVAKQLVEKRGGQISVTSSTEPGCSGTSILIFIPFEYEAETAAA